MIIAAYAIGSHKAYVYIRGEYFGRPSASAARSRRRTPTAGWARTSREADSIWMW